MHLLDLSNELLATIAVNIHPRDIVNFSLTCHRIHDCSSPSLKLHRTRLKTLRVQHDRNPKTIIDLLNLSLTSPEELWYLRILEIYGSRSTWEEWKTYYSYRHMKDEPSIDLSTIASQLVSDLNLENLTQNEALITFIQANKSRIQKGDDQPLKTLLFASLPSLQKVTWVAHDSDSENQPFSLLCSLISTCTPLPHTLWPAGLISLRSISLGACTSHIHPHDNLHPEIQDFCLLFLLPNLKCLRINVAGFGDQDLSYLEEKVPAGSSSVEDIAIYVSDFNRETTLAILKRCRWLRSYVSIYLGECEMGLKDMQSWCGDSLEVLRMEGSNDWSLKLFDDVSLLSGFPNLRVLTIFVGDLSAGKLTEGMLSGIGAGMGVKWRDFDEVLPPLLEDIIFEWPPRHFQRHVKEDKLHLSLFPAFFRTLDVFVRKRTVKEGGCLKRVCLGFMDDKGIMGFLQEKEADEFKNVVEQWAAVWKDMGVEVVMDSLQGEGVDEVLECEPVLVEDWQERFEKDKEE